MVARDGLFSVGDDLAGSIVSEGDFALTVRVRQPSQEFLATLFFHLWAGFRFRFTYERFLKNQGAGILRVSPADVSQSPQDVLAAKAELETVLAELKHLVHTGCLRYTL